MNIFALLWIHLLQQESRSALYFLKWRLKEVFVEYKIPLGFHNGKVKSLIYH